MTLEEPHWVRVFPARYSRMGFLATLEQELYYYILQYGWEVNEHGTSTVSRRFRVLYVLLIYLLQVGWSEK